MIDKEVIRFNSEIKKVCQQYLSVFPQEADMLNRLVLTSDQPVDLRSRKTIPEGHICANSIILSPDSSKVLLLKHKSLGIWVIPGGHYDIEDQTPSNTALREAMEETGLKDITVHPWHQENPIPLDIVINPIPANPKKGEGAHVHFDFSYVTKVPAGQEIKIDPNESLGYKWVPVEEFDKTDSLSKAIKKLSIAGIK